MMAAREKEEEERLRAERREAGERRKAWALSGAGTDERLRYISPLLFFTPSPFCFLSLLFVFQRPQLTLHLTPYTLPEPVVM